MECCPPANRVSPVRRSGRTAIATTLLLAMLAAVSAETAPADRSSGSALRIDIRGAIGPATAEYVRDGVQEATRRNASAVVLTLDTPGGLESAMRDIVRAVLDAPIPVISYVSPTGARAASAGTFVVYASHLAAMAPSTHLGAATPVQIGGGLGGSDGKQADKSVAETKAINDAVAYIKGLAGLRGRNAEWAEKAVREAATLTAAEAVAQNVVEIVADDIPDLLRKADGRSVRIGDRHVALATADLAIVSFAPDWRNRVLATITNPTIAYILMLVGLYGLLFEFISPGAAFPGVIGGIALLLGLYGLNFLPVSYAGSALLLLGIALMVAEVFVPSFGALGIGGIIAFAAGSLFLIRGDIPGYQLSWPVVALATASSAAFLMIALAAAWRAHRRAVATGDPALIGTAGQVVAWTDGEGEVHVHGERWRARGATTLNPGQRVRIVERRNLTLVVEPDTETPPRP